MCQNLIFCTSFDPVYCGGFFKNVWNVTHLPNYDISADHWMWVAEIYVSETIKKISFNPPLFHSLIFVVGCKFRPKIPGNDRGLLNQDECLFRCLSGLDINKYFSRAEFKSGKQLEILWDDGFQVDLNAHVMSFAEIRGSCIPYELIVIDSCRANCVCLSPFERNIP